MEKFSLNELQTALLTQGIIDLQGTIDDEMFQYVRDCLVLLAVKGNPPIRIQISSNGGVVATGLVIYDLLRLYPGEKTGVVIGFARSMAGIVLQACTTRLCTQNSFVLVHHINRSEVDLDEVTDKKKLKKIVALMTKEQVKLYRILEERTDKSRTKIIALCKKDTALSAEEALEFGLIDKII